MLNNPERVEFTKEMRDTYTILIPEMCEIHFRLLTGVCRHYGLNVVPLNNGSSSVINTGLKYVHNDICYPALLVIGQMIEALQSGKYDVHKTALMITQTGGGCRASNYIHLLRKALKKAGLEFVPVISLNLNGLEKNSGFKPSVVFLLKVLAAFNYGDLLMLLKNQTEPYELVPGKSAEMVEKWVDILSRDINRGTHYLLYGQRRTMVKIANDFANIPMTVEKKVKVGIVGEIYVKFSPLGNNHLEDFLRSQDCEVMIPGVMGFMYYCIVNASNDLSLYGGSFFRRRLYALGCRALDIYSRNISKAISRHRRFTAPAPFSELGVLAEDIIQNGCKMGEGWLLTSEMVELIRHGFENIVCTQPFGCLPNHIAGRGKIREIRDKYPDANIVAIDYDPGATAVNQENRIKLMLAMAREKLAEREAKPQIAEETHATIA